MQITNAVVFRSQLKTRYLNNASLKLLIYLQFFKFKTDVDLILHAFIAYKV